MLWTQLQKKKKKKKKKKGPPVNVFCQKLGRNRGGGGEKSEKNVSSKFESNILTHIPTSMSHRFGDMLHKNLVL